MRGVPRIARRAKVANDAAASVGKLVQVEFAEQNCASGFKSPNDFRVRGGNIISKDSAGRSGFDAGRFYQIFYGHGNAVQRPLPFSAGDLSFSFAGRFQRRCIRYGNESVQLWIQSSQCARGKLE